MTVTQMPQCCGVQIYSGFGNTGTASDKTAYTKEVITEFLKEKEYISKMTRQSMIIVSLNGEQMPIIGNIFKERDYEVVAENYHPNHASTIYILVKKLTYQ